MKSQKTSSNELSPSGERKIAPLRLNAAAEADLEAIDEYSNDMFGDDVADAYMCGFGELFDLLRSHPLAGPITPEFGEGIRCVIHRKHRIFYKIEGELVLILRVIHHARNAKRELNS